MLSHTLTHTQLPARYLTHHSAAHRGVLLGHVAHYLAVAIVEGVVVGLLQAQLREISLCFHYFSMLISLYASLQSR
jgi:flagellar biosynthesis protein FliQ